MLWALHFLTSLAPSFPFVCVFAGYSTFTYSNLQVSGSVSSSSNATITVDILNNGPVDGAEVAQLYVAFPAAANEPPKLLRGFSKTQIGNGATATVSFTLTAQSLSIYDVTQMGWVLTPGTYTLMVGSSSRDIRVTGTLTV